MSCPDVWTPVATSRPKRVKVTEPSVTSTKPARTSRSTAASVVSADCPSCSAIVVVLQPSGRTVARTRRSISPISDWLPTWDTLTAFDMTDREIGFVVCAARHAQSSRIFTADARTARTMTWANLASGAPARDHLVVLRGSGRQPGSAVGHRSHRWAVVGGASLVSVFVFGDLPRLRRQFRQLVPTGAEFAVGLRATAMSLRTPLSVGRYDCSAFKSLDLSGDYVFLRSALGSSYFVLPRRCSPTKTSLASGLDSAPALSR